MVSYCCVIGCRNNSYNKNKDPNAIISFHAFPSCPDLKNKWLRAIGRTNWTPPAYTRVCSAHFNTDQINYNGCRVRLKDDATPVILLPSNSNFEANVEACRICLAVDVKMYSLQGTVLGTCMETITDKNENFNIDGLPQYVCYQCAPFLIQCSELIQKCIASQTSLLGIFAKNGQVTKTLIKEHCQSEQKSSPNNKTFAKINSNFNVTKSELNNDEASFIYENDHDCVKVETQDIETSKCKIEENEAIDNNESSSLGEGVVHDDDCSKDSSSTGQDGKETDSEVKHIKKKVARTKNNGVTPDETDMLKYFNIVELSLQEQIQEWENSTVRRPLKSDTVYKCEVCNKIFVNASTYRVHITYHDASHGQAECPVCKLRFISAAVAASHSKRAHSRKFCCKMCPKAFNNVGVAKKHQRWHLGYVYECGTSPFRSRNAPHVTHVTHVPHVTHVQHVCAICGCGFTSSRSRRIHMRTKHTNMKGKDISKYRCDQCNIGFTSENAYRVHILTSIHVKKSDRCTNEETDPRKCCKTCGKDCGSFKELVLHNRADHGRMRRSSHPWRGDTPYPVSCEICGETISSRRKHWLHVRRRHPKQVNTYQPVITAVCDTCGKGYQNATKLRLHKLRHRSPTVRCQQCPRMFYDKYALIRHARTHNAERPHQCRVCGRAFKVQSNLDRHAIVHTDDAPYECTICGKKFKHSSSVNLHVRTVHYKLPQPPRKKRSKSAKNASDS